jgi:type IV secretion system protein VirB8
VTDEKRSQYYQRAESWAESEQRSLIRGARGARLMAVAFAVIAGLEAFSLILLMPLKSVTMVPILVDRQTGFVEVLKADGSQAVTANQALTQSLLAQYVVARESFNVTNLAAAYHKVALWSAGPARADYVALMPASNPASPLRLYPRTTLVETWVKSVSPLGPQAALVRFETRRLDESARSGAPQEWAAVIAYRYSNEALSASDRWLNPLSFQVVSYHRDAEAQLPEPTSAAQGAASNSAAMLAAAATASPNTSPGAPAARRP